MRAEIAGFSSANQKGAAHVRETGLAPGYKLALIAGFMLFGIGVFAAHQAPASSYEVSIYWSTPTVYWVGVGGALLVSLGTLVYDARSRLAPLSMLLGIISVSSFLALPVIRNYYFHGYADPMTHLGRIRALSSGYLTYLEPLYPGSYGLTVVLSNLSGLSINRTMLYVMLVFGLIFILFVPLTVKAIVPDRYAFVLGLFAGFLILPVNNVSLFYRFHPFSLATLFFPLVAFLFVGHVTRSLDDDRLWGPMDASSLALPLVTTGLLLIHPQATVDVLIVFAMVLAVQVAVRWYAPDHPLAKYKGIHWQFLLLAVLFTIWVSMHQGGTGRTVTTLLDGIYGALFGQTETAQVVQSRSSSAGSIGVSIVELFVKYFLVSAVFSALAAGVIIAKFLGRLPADATRERPIYSDVVTLFAIGGIGLLPFIVVHSFGKADDYLFRHIGFWMAIVTILGAVGLYYLLRNVSLSLGSIARRLKPVFGVLAAALIVLSLLSVYSSPFLYLPGQHVSEQEMQGMETAFEMQPADRTVWFGGIRQNANRYESAMFAAPNTSWEGSPRVRISKPVSDENLSRLQTYYENHPEVVVRRDQYLMVSTQDYKTEVEAYNGVRYSEANITSVYSQRGVYKIYANGEADLFYVDTSGDPIIPEQYADDPAPRNSTQNATVSGSSIAG